MHQLIDISYTFANNQTSQHILINMIHSFFANLVVFLELHGYVQVMATPQDQTMMTKVFNYLGAMPIRDDRTGEIIKGEPGELESKTPIITPGSHSKAEAACWRLINEQSGE